jgi:hypothetical protein
MLTMSGRAARAARRKYKLLLLRSLMEENAERLAELERERAAGCRLCAANEASR